MVLATVVGMLIEVPVMLSVVKIVNATSAWYGVAPASRATPSAAQSQLCHPAADIFRGTLAPGTSESLDFVWFAISELSYNCHNALA